MRLGIVVVGVIVTVGSVVGDGVEVLISTIGEEVKPNGFVTVGIIVGEAEAGTHPPKNIAKRMRATHLLDFCIVCSSLILQLDDAIEEYMVPSYLLFRKRLE